MINNNNTKPKLYGPNEQPFGKPWDEWTKKWWQWFFSIPVENHPVYDKTGEKSGVNQVNPDVWFLAGTIGGRAERTITVPAGKAILFPVINIATSYSENPSLNTEEEMISFVNNQVRDIAKKEASIDGDNLIISENHRVRSNSIEFSFPPNNIYGVQEGPTRGVGDGYWIFLKPLSPGMHDIRTSGACMSGRIQIDVNIKLIVE